MRFEHIITACLKEAKGTEGAAGASDWPDADALSSEIARLLPFIRSLRQATDEGRMPHLSLPARKDDLDEIRDAAAFLSEGAQDVFILGTGGSSLGAQALCQLGGWQVAGARRGGIPRLHFLDNLDAESFEKALDGLDLEKVKIFAVSKSGGTAEPILQSLAFLAAFEERGWKDRVKNHFLGLSEPRKPGGKNQLRDLLEPYGVKFLEHDPDLGGRYSVLSNVGLVPAAIAGVDVARVRDGALLIRDQLFDAGRAETAPPVVGAALNAAFMRAFPQINMTVLWGYAERLRRFTAWWVQLWAESLGKDGKGTTPIGAIGPVDQHSQQQLYLAGPRDKLFTVIETQAEGRGPVVPRDLAARLGAETYAGKAVGDLVASLQRGTVETLINNRLPVRRILVDEVDEVTLGALLMHFMLETILCGHLMGVDPFDQPAVEEGKVLARKYLAELGKDV